MVFYADLHLHSRFSRATAKSCDLENLALWARKKGLSLLGTGDFTHPAWRAELKKTLREAETGLYCLAPEIDAAVKKQLPSSCQEPVRFLLSAEISTIYKKSGRTRKVHHVVFVPDFDAAERMVRALERIGNLASDGRPILGLDSRDLLEIVLSAGEGCYLVPAHIWTPWFSALGSASGFDSIDDCYGDLASHVFALETGLSSDPAMNWRVSRLDRFRLISCSDAHSPQMLGREACAFDTLMDYFSVRRALETGQGYLGTVEFYPEEGKYHLDGHRNCGVRLTPEQTRQYGGACPVCGKPVTVGVMSRVQALADRPSDCAPPPTAGKVWSLVPLPEILGEISGVGPKSKSVTESYERLIGRLGPELSILTRVPLEQIARDGSPLLQEAICRLRAAKVIRDAGYDGEYGTIRLFDIDELARITKGASLFENACAPTVAPVRKRKTSFVPPVGKTAQFASPSRTGGSVLPSEPSSVEENTQISVPTPAGGRAQPSEPSPAGGRGQGEGGDCESTPVVSRYLSALDPDQRRAAQAIYGAVLIAAGPGSGKTRTLTHRIAHLVADGGAASQQCLTITFSRRAASELRERLEQLSFSASAAVPVFTFHALALAILQEQPAAAGLAPGFRVIGQQEQLQVLESALRINERKARALIERISKLQRSGQPADDAALVRAARRYRERLKADNTVDYDGLIEGAIGLLASDPAYLFSLQQRYRWISIDEYQDIDARQYQFIRTLVPANGNLCAIGDPNQAIYAFRGADPSFFYRFAEDFPGAQRFSLTRNYRSSATIVEASSQMIAPQLSARPPVEAVSDNGCKISIHQAASELAEAEFVVQTIEQLLGGHSFFSVDSGRGAERPPLALSFDDIALLYRTESQSHAAVEALARSGIPFQKRSHEPLAERPGVRALVRALGRETAGRSLRERLLSAAQNAASESVPDETASKEPIEAALELLLPLADRCGDNLDAFCLQLALATEVDTWDPRAERVSLLTLHAAKGLEFAVVFILGCEQGILPLTWPGDDPTVQAEERRLFYVGMTRARDLLFLCHARKRRWRGKVQALPSSIFLQDIEDRLVEERTGGRSHSKKPNTNQQLSLF